MLATFLITLLTIVFLAALHEFGHFILAKKMGVKIEEFGLGYPPRVLGKKIGETTYSLNLLPFGAFVRPSGEEDPIEDWRSLKQKAIWQRALITLGGVVSFWIIGVILLTIVFNLGMPTAILDTDLAPNSKVQIVDIASNSPAQMAGLQMGDSVKKLTIDNLQFPIAKVEELQKLIEEYKGEEIVLTIERGKEIFDVNLVPRVSPPPEEGSLGVSLVRVVIKNYPFYIAPLKAMDASIKTTLNIFEGFSQTFTSLIGGEGLPQGVELMGPVGIAVLISHAFQTGFIYYLQFVAIIAFHLAIINALPIPALDGGKLLFLGIEKIKGSPINQKTEKNINATFFALLVLLMILVTIKDLVKIF